MLYRLSSMLRKPPAKLLENWNIGEFKNLEMAPTAIANEGFLRPRTL